MEAIEVRESQAKLAAVMAASYFAATDELVLYDTTFTPTPTSDLTAFNAGAEASTNVVAFTLEATWLPGLDAEGRGLNIQSVLALFTPAGTAVFPFIVGGWFIRQTVGAHKKVLAYAPFDNPVTFNTAADVLLVKAFVYQQMLGNADAEFIAGP